MDKREISLGLKWDDNIFNFIVEYTHPKILYNSPYKLMLLTLSLMIIFADMMRLVIDMDEVLADPMAKFIKLVKRDYGIDINHKDLNGIEFREVLDSSISYKVNEYINEKGFFRDLDVIDGAADVVKKLSEKYDIYIVSAAMEFRNSLEDKYDWLSQHFPFIHWNNIVFCGNKIVDADLMIDDRIRNFETFKGRKLLFSSPPNFYVTSFERVNTWAEVA